jgi:4-hydroxy-tetrahydrodipicolinate synthase
MVTPLAAPDQLDEPGLERLVEHMIAGGVHGLFLLGTCGEGPSLSYRLRRQLIDRACAQVDRRVPVLVSITDTSYVESVALARYAADAGADAVVLAPPFYLPLTQAELLDYVLRLVGELPLPLVLYNVPALTKLNFEPPTVRRLMDEESIVGLKDSSGDLAYFQTIRHLSRERPDWTLLMGPEHLLSRALELGGDGGVSGGANVWPQLFVQMYDATIATSDSAIAEQIDVVHHLVDQVDRLGQIYRLGPPSPSSVIKGLKCALSVLGICGDLVAEPLGQCSPAERQHVENVIRSLGLRQPSAGELATLRR